MEEILTSWIDSTSWPIISAFLLGLLTVISPCALMTNITAIGYISTEVERPFKVFANGLVFTAGKAFAYTILALILFFGANAIHASGFFQQYGEKIIGPVLILIGLLMLDVIPLKFSSNLIRKKDDKKIKSFWDVFLLGIVFALAFCPYSGVLYFGLLIPMSISHIGGMYLPLVYALGACIPVVLFAWIIAFTLTGVTKWYERIRGFEKWFRKMVALLFIGIGSYYIIAVLL